MADIKHIITKRPNGTLRVQTDTSGWKHKTDQSFKNDCDVNLIMARFLKGQPITHLRNGQGAYADVSQIPDLSEALNTVTKAQEAFNSLPAQIRKRFGNSPVNMVEFMSDPNNYKEAADLGLLTLKPIKLSDASHAPKPPVGNKTSKKTQSKGSKNDDDSNDDE